MIVAPVSSRLTEASGVFTFIVPSPTFIFESGVVISTHAQSVVIVVAPALIVAHLLSRFTSTSSPAKFIVPSFHTSILPSGVSTLTPHPSTFIVAHLASIVAPSLSTFILPSGPFTCIPSSHTLILGPSPGAV